MRIKSLISIADVEIANVKKARLSSDSLYYKKVFVDYATSNCGFRRPVISDEDRIGAHEEWLEAYRHFCRQTVNTKGKKLIENIYRKSTTTAQHLNDKILCQQKVRN